MLTAVGYIRRRRRPGVLPAALLLARMRSVRRRVGLLLDGWRRRALAIPDPELRHQALASLQSKAFHCHGGAVFALAAPRARREDLLGFIVALQTISDYLDNLCDRSPAGGEADLRQLHRAYADALQPGAPPRDYYVSHPARHDGGYLGALVQSCHRSARGLAGYGGVRPHCAHLASAYIELQVLKHLPGPERTRRVAIWAVTLAPASGLTWWELAAAAGSTLGIFALAAAAAGEANPRGDAAAAIASAYFPHVTALHILLDYLIDQEEDRATGDMNFIEFYGGGAEAEEALAAALRRAADSVAGLPAPSFHALVVAGLPAIYLADDKASRPELAAASRRLLALAGPGARTLHAALRGWGHQGLRLAAGTAGYRRA